VCTPGKNLLRNGAETFAIVLDYEKRTFGSFEKLPLPVVAMMVEAILSRNFERYKELMNAKGNPYN